MRVFRILFITVFPLFSCGCASSLSAENYFTQENTSYIISTTMDLGGKRIFLPKNSTLIFRGGSIKNGTIVCNNTTFKGRPQVDNLTGTVTNKEVYSSWIKNNNKLAILCQVKADKIVLDEDIILHQHNINDLKANNFDGGGHTIRIDYNLYELGALIRCFDNVRSIKNVKFDFCGHEFHSIGIWFPHRTESIVISNVSFSNLNNLSVRKFGFQGVAISATEVQGYSFKNDITIDISDIHASDLKALSDNSGEDGESTITIVCVRCDAPSTSRIALDVKIHDCAFKEIVVFDNDGQVTPHDAACIYVHQEAINTNSKTIIDNIQGFNFGRRLVKTDGGNLTINNIKGESYNGGSLYMVGCNNGGKSHSARNAMITNLRFKGRISGILACMVDKSVVHGIKAEFTDSIKPRVLSGLVFVGDDATCSISDVNVKGKCFLYTSTSRTNTTMKNVKLFTDDSIEGTHYLFNTFNIESFELSDFFFDIAGSNPTLMTYKNASQETAQISSALTFRNGRININGATGKSVITDYSTNHPYSLSVDNVEINVKEGTAPVINLVSSTLKKADVKGVSINFKTAGAKAKVMNLNCNDDAEYSISDISCNQYLKQSPVSITGSAKSRVSLGKMSVKGKVAIDNNVRVRTK